MSELMYQGQFDKVDDVVILHYTGLCEAQRQYWSQLKRSLRLVSTRGRGGGPRSTGSLIDHRSFGGSFHYLTCLVTACNRGGRAL